MAEGSEEGREKLTYKGRELSEDQQGEFCGSHFSMTLERPVF